MAPENRHVVIVGCARRIGLALTQHFLKKGYRVSGLYRTKSPELVELEGQFGELFKAFMFDLRHPQHAQELAANTATQNGHAYALIHVASQFYRTPLGQVT
ncbi:MAG: SDR family NAD(P)-dependent oxidoreductase, partial [Proteobacteria bacterium]|nr:SDR family NAD(P)-dependent oxidoreductase [Pseudomonadota bacterium]